MIVQVVGEFGINIAVETYAVHLPGIAVVNCVVRTGRFRNQIDLDIETDNALVLRAS
jgi:hypothetical protein